MTTSKLLIWSIAMILSGSLYAQSKFGKISSSDFDLTNQNFDTSVNAVVLADVGSSSFQGNNKGWFTLNFKKHTRIKILNSNGFDAANVVIVLYIGNNNAEEKVNNLKAITYNLEGNKVVPTELDKKSVFRDKYDKNIVLVKFTLPAVKEGSIIEYSYNIASDFLTNLQPWTFQGEYPVLYSQYDVKIPEFFNYVFLSQGTFVLEHSTKTNNDTYNVMQPGGTGSSKTYTLTSRTSDHQWIARNAPALKEESYTSTTKNHVSKVEFQLSQYRFPNQPIENIMGDWNTLAVKLMKQDNFGADLSKSNSFFDDDLKPLLANIKDPLEKSKVIYAYIKNNYTATGKRGYGLTTTLRSIHKAKSGYNAEINLLLTAALRRYDINAYPVLLSTRTHGYTHPFYPLIDRFNYVVTNVNIDGTQYFLDATDPMLGFNKLPLECYNGHARILYPQSSESVMLLPDTLVEKKLTSVIIQSLDGGQWEGTISNSLGYYESMNVRERIKKDGKENFFKTIQTAYTAPWTLDEETTDFLENLESPVKVRYHFKMPVEENIIYFNPMMQEGYKNNPFKSVERHYPVEMYYNIDETYILSLQIPKGYKVEEVPKSARVALSDNSMFEYLIDQSEDVVRLRSRIKISQTYFEAPEYNDLREFYSYIVKKHAEVIVLKKID